MARSSLLLGVVLLCFFLALSSGKKILPSRIEELKKAKAAAASNADLKIFPSSSSFSSSSSSSSSSSFSSSSSSDFSSSSKLASQKEASQVLHQHLVNLTNHLNITQNATNATRTSRWALVMPKPSNSKHIPDVPADPLTCDKELWEKLMPRPLKTDLKPWLEKGFDSTDYKKNCTLPNLAAVAYMYEGHVYYEDVNHSNNAKYRKFWKLLGLVSQYLHKKYGSLPVLRFAFSISSVALLDFNENCTFPEGHDPEKLSIPYFVLAKRKEDSTVRMPTPYFTPLWANEAEKLNRGRSPWETKNNTGCWIGATNTMPGGRSRLLLLAEANRLSQESEVFEKFFNVHPFSSPKKRFHDWRKLGYFDNRTFDLIGKSRSLSKQHTSWFGGCKYNFHLPGHTRGGYSRALQTLIPQGTAIFKFESPWDEYYYDWLEEGKHYIPYNNETLRDTILYYLKHDEEGKKIAEASANFYAEHLSWDNILRYWEWLTLSMLRYDQTSQDTRVPPTACQCHLEERRFEGRCKFCSPLHQAARRARRKEKSLKIQARREEEKARELASVVLVAPTEGEGEDDADV